MWSMRAGTSMRTCRLLIHGIMKPGAGAQVLSIINSFEDKLVLGDMLGGWSDVVASPTHTGVPPCSRFLIASNLRPARRGIASVPEQAAHTGRTPHRGSGNSEVPVALPPEAAGWTRSVPASASHSVRRGVGPRARPGIRDCPGGPSTAPIGSCTARAEAAAQGAAMSNSSPIMSSSETSRRLVSRGTCIASGRAMGNPRSNASRK